ncbi:MAG: hypothetical protein F4117_03210 [Acidimicrobiales bacterium]|nr:hypothetical protein [Acidimicrobiaceae bacterium]MXV86453.1 hypothetical protein [Acidimicrobiales bacterium]MXX42822.1 hypothetical protein [Acidimicrobiales bacterium]MYA81616.1 hypothetical protein [Acidimicrobiales bacterium]MYB81305.1 hypothetical protein [Acidimicrobiales bacterium]
MARSAAAKKVAKAASAGGSGRSFRPRRDILFPAAMLLVVLLGVVLILVARNERSSNAPAGPPRLGDHWHSLYAIYDCDEFIGDLYPNDVDDQSGIHTHGDGLIHIHPFHTGVTGQFATVGAFMREIEFELTDSRIELPDGTILDESGEGCASPDPDSDDPDISEPGAELRIMRWETLQAEKALAFTEDLRDVRFLDDGQIFVFAFVHPSVENADVPRPDDAFLRAYLNLPPEDQPLIDGSTEEGPVLDDGSETEPVEGDLPATSEPSETSEPAE